jgi:hypothetical protein
MAEFHPRVVDGPGIAKKSLATERRKDNLVGLEAIIVFLRNRL